MLNVLKIEKMKNAITFKELIRPSNDYHWYGLIILLLGILLGGAVGGAIGGLTGSLIILIRRNREYSNIKKLLLTISLTLGGFILYVVLVMFLLNIIPWSK